jgi:hypothetical protein
MVNNAAVQERLASIETNVEAIARGLIMMVETLGTHSQMLAEILEACSVDPGPSPVTAALEELVEAMEEQNETLVAIGQSLDRIGPTIEGAVIRGVHRAVGTVDEDGVILE